MVLYLTILLILQLQFVNASIFNKSSRIIDGKNAEEGQFPYVVSLATLKKDRSKTLFCGGAILDENFVLTAAHCIHVMLKRPHEFDIKNVRIFAGHTSSPEFINEEGRKIKKYYIHPEWNEKELTGDVCVLKVDKPFIFNDKTIQPIKLVSAGIPPGVDCTIAGWGLTDSHDTTSGASSLKYITVKVIKKEVCRKFFRESTGNLLFKVGKTRTCAGVLDGNYGACMGDSGCPLVCEKGLFGVASFALLPCGKAGYADFYADAFHYRNWINSCQLGEKSCGNAYSISEISTYVLLVVSLPIVAVNIYL